MGNPVVWFEIHVENMARAKKFYETVFGVQLSRLENPNHEMWAFPSQQDSYGSGGSLIHIEGVRPGGNSVMVYFHCEDCAVEAAKAMEAGGKIMKDKFSIGPHGHIALVFDTEGNMIGLHSM